jgi:TRAP-type C4-dicarboxylate transport system substrate-binding protein
MLTRIATALGAVAALALSVGASGAQTNLKWAHVYETSEPFHTEVGVGGGEIEKRTEGRYHIDVFPASQLGKESDINQGANPGHGGHHHLRIELRGS